MAKSHVVVFVSAGMLAPKKRDHALARRQLYLNYGALTLATLIEHSGYRAALIHGEHREPFELLTQLHDAGYLPSSHPLMLSIPSFYALPWAQEFCRLFKGMYPNNEIVVGGRWVVGPDPEWFRTMLPESGRLVPGLGEGAILGLLNAPAPVEQFLKAPTPDFPLNHRLVDGYEAFQPSIEASRGCGMKCVFCEERDIRLEPLRDPAQTAEYLEITAAQYESRTVHPYLQASFFAPGRRWASQLADEVQRRNLKIEWRTETRVDGLQPEAAAELARAGLKIIDLGLETASPVMVTAMKKSRRPDRYLSQASALLRACRDNGILVKANVLLYAGETIETLGQTVEWLDAHASCITGVSVGPVVAYGPPKTAKVLLTDWAQRGAVPIDPRASAETGISRMHLSPEIDAETAEAKSLEISRRFMDADAYFTLKSFSYYPRDFSRLQFDQDVANSDPLRLPFRAAPTKSAA